MNVHLTGAAIERRDYSIFSSSHGVYLPTFYAGALRFLGRHGNISVSRIWFFWIRLSTFLWKTACDSSHMLASSVFLYAHADEHYYRVIPGCLICRLGDLHSYGEVLSLLDVVPHYKTTKQHGRVRHTPKHNISESQDDRHGIVLYCPHSPHPISLESIHLQFLQTSLFFCCASVAYKYLLLVVAYIIAYEYLQLQGEIYHG